MAIRLNQKAHHLSTNRLYIHLPLCITMIFKGNPGFFKVYLYFNSPNITKKIMVKTKEENGKELITADELAAYLHFSKKTIYNMVKENTLPAIRIGDSLRFSRSEIDGILTQRNKKMINILVIDDAESVCRVMRRVLENKGHTVITSTSGARGLEHLEAIKFDHIFLDICMPDMDGIEALRRIREMNSAVPVTLITGHPDSRLIQQAESYGISRIIRKPFGTCDVLSAINN